ncbi:hypothetical protein L198_07482 [Cryptococcus wingfieldii CBS 7118]|uniref:Pre-rRNA-processing protein RIX1 n=1 Tax=Cryptococcus wingfieldii CBS 7118 TaxID=1295528 RepID=A0A1E3IAI4_9TREE|nr:hypothetical protein L198_07482 [Cryptococcus wingfieldii CBS 7118]ODN85653.1 hypothetical protein L198_07482 [Cryptococcus wingfieldii CBS 7118]
MAEATPILPLLSSLPLAHPSLRPLLQSHTPLARPSTQSQSQLTKLLNRLNTVLLSRDDSSEKRAACEVAKVMVEQDQEGWVLAEWGKGWVGGCLGWIASTSSSIASIPPYLELLTTIVLTAPHFPSFERQTVHPLMGKLSVSLGKLLERSLSESQPEWDVICTLLESIQMLLLQSPANFRPSTPAFKTNLFALLLMLPTPTSPSPSIPSQIRQQSAKLLAALHVTSGKAQSPAAWTADMKQVLGGLGKALGGITSDAWEEDPVTVPPPASTSTPDLPADPLQRLPIALDWLEGLTQATLEMLSFPTSRPVAIPLAGLHHAFLIASLPRIWAAGTQLLAAVALATGDHLFPHLSNIFDHSVWLLERIPQSMCESRTLLLRFHSLLLTLYPPSLLPVEYPTRLLRSCLSSLSPLLGDKRESVAAASKNESGGGKRGKKRARGAEDGLVGDLEGKGRRGLSHSELDCIISALSLTPLLHTASLLAPSLLTLSVRLHLSIYLGLPSLPTSTFPEVGAREDVRVVTRKVLEKVLSIGEGWSKGYESVIVSVLDAASQPSIRPTLHPKLPPMIRHQPALSELHFFAKETDEEKKVRKELGFGLEGEVVDGEEMEEDEVPAKRVAAVAPVVQAPVQVAAQPQFAQPAPVVAPVAVQQPAPVALQAPATAPAPITLAPQPPIPTFQTPNQPAESFISFTNTTTTSSSTNPSASASTQTQEKVVETVSERMQVDDDDEALPEMDSGSEDELELDDDEEDDE